MTVLLRYKSPLKRALQRENGMPRMRRTSIYPHRSVRALPVTLDRGILAFVVAAMLTVAIVGSIHTLLDIHNRITVAMLHLAGIQVDGVMQTELFARLGSAPVPMVETTNIGAHPLELWLMVSGVGLVLLEVHRRIAFAHSFLLCIAVLLAATVGAVLLYPASQFDTATFASMWLRGEFLIWLILPWFSASLFILMQPASFFGAVCTVFTQAYGLAWSAIRLALCIGLMHYTGILFMPVAWFLLGLLADVVYLMVFFSLALQWTSKRNWGTRRLA